MINKKESRKKCLINLALVFVIIIAAVIIFVKESKADIIYDIDLGAEAHDNVDTFLSKDYRNVGELQLWVSPDGTNNNGSIGRDTIACIDPDHNANTSDDALKNQPYSIQAIVDIDNPFNTSLSDWTGLNVTVPDQTTYDTVPGQWKVPEADLIKRARFISGIMNWALHGNSGLTDKVYSTQSLIDTYLQVNFNIFCTYARSSSSPARYALSIMANDKIPEEEYTGSRFPQWHGTAWQTPNTYTDVAISLESVYEEARSYAENLEAGVVGGVTNATTGDPSIEYTSNAAILGPYRLNITGGASVTGITITCSNATYDTSRITILNSSKQPISIGSIPSGQDFYIQINDVPGEITSIKLQTTGSTVHATRILLLAGKSHQRLAVFTTKDTNGSAELTLKVPPAEPKIVKYKYIKSIQQLQTDGSYKTLFNITQPPTLTISNLGKNNASVSSVKYPDYSQYCEVGSNGEPVVNDGDLVEFAWVIYNIGPGNTSPGTTVKLDDVPDKGYVIQSGKQNGWTLSGSTYSKTITLNSSLAGIKSGTDVKYYTGTDTTIYFEVNAEDVPSGTNRIYNNQLVPTALQRPKLETFKFIKALRKLKDDGTYETVFDIANPPTITVSNAGTENATITKINYPDYSQYCEVDSNGFPKVEDGDIVVFGWAIYNIGPAMTYDNTQVTLTDTPDAGYELRAGLENGWTASGGNYTKTITLSTRLAGLSANGTPSYYMGSDTLIYLEVVGEEVNNQTETIKNNNGNTTKLLKPKLETFKFIKELRRLKDDGTYETVFNIANPPTITVSNAGENSATLTRINYPDYSQYCEVDENGFPKVEDGDIVVFGWAIYNIGPGRTYDNTQVTLTDTPDAGYELIEGQENGWTASGGNYTKTITLSTRLPGLSANGTPSYYMGSDTLIYLEVVGEEVNDQTEVIQNNNGNDTKLLKPKIVTYKYIKSIKQLQGDGSYIELFNITEIPTLTVANIGTNDATVTNVQYPDYSKYCDVDENGVPYVEDGDLVEYEWVIYNIGPGRTYDDMQVTIDDVPDVGYRLQSGKENGWTSNGSTYSKTFTLTQRLPGLKANGTPAYYRGEDTTLYLVVVAEDKLQDTSSNTGYIYNNNQQPTRLSLSIEGVVFKDNIAQKDGREDGIISTGDEFLPGVEVTLFTSNGTQVGQTTTDENGHYEFLHLDYTETYYVRFKYNGQIYEPTTYQTQKKYTGEGDNQVDTTIAERSYATDGVQNRQSFNNKFTPVDASHVYPSRDDVNNAEFMIYAYTGSNGLQNLLTYSEANTKEELKNVNFGIKAREEFDMNLRKDLVQVDLTINGKSHTYEYNGSGEDLEVTIRGTDVPDYERTIRRSDLEFKSAAQYDNDSDKLQVYVTYKIQIRNQSMGQITGYITDLNDYYDTSYQLVRSYDENNNNINWTQESDVTGNGKRYYKMHTTDLANEGITDQKWIFMQYKVSAETLREVLNTGSTLEENFAEIAGYRNTYTNDRYDLNGNKITNAGDVAGLLDIDSTPDNMNPTDSEVQNFVAESKTDAYQNLDGEEKTKRSSEVFEDDADVAPGLRLIREDQNRTITGVIFEDAPDLARLQNNNERVGNGEYESGEHGINEVNVELICTNNNEVTTISDRSDSNGNYSIEGYIPGDYYIKFTYGDETCLKAMQVDNEVYSGQDYKSTIYNESNYSNNVYWYQNTSPRSNDAGDNYTRRQEVNNYSKDYKYDVATVLNSTPSNNPDLLDELAANTQMDAETTGMSVEIEYLGQEQTAYDITNVDFGIIERPRTKIVLQKDVSHVKLVATDGSTIFDSDQSVSNLTWVPNQYNNRGDLDGSPGFVQGTVDENLLYGSTVTVRYHLRIENQSEKDYNEESYYYTGVVSNYNTANTLKPMAIIDYLPNSLQYSDVETMANGLLSINGGITTPGVGNSFSTSIAGSNNYWQIVADKNQSMTLPEAEYKGILLSPDAYDDVQNITQILLTELPNTQSPLAEKGYIDLDDILSVTKVIARPEETTQDDKSNVAEIIRVEIANGRRPYFEEETNNTEIVEIPGNAEPVAEIHLDEPDTALAENVQFMVPFGANRQVALVIILVAALGILVTGIIVIKKKVL